jgi:hypothetical protein
MTTEVALLFGLCLGLLISVCVLAYRSYKQERLLAELVRDLQTAIILDESAGQQMTFEYFRLQRRHPQPPHIPPPPPRPPVPGGLR